jgi:hypothetical protein
VRDDEVSWERICIPKLVCFRGTYERELLVQKAIPQVVTTNHRHTGINEVVDRDVGAKWPNRNTATQITECMDRPSRRNLTQLGVLE